MEKMNVKEVNEKGGYVMNKAMSKDVYEKVNELVKNGNLYEETHLHSKDQYDSDNDAMAVCKRLKELGRKTVFLTQHGVAAATWSFKEAAKEYGLKFVPGVETYYQKDASKDESGIMTYDSVKGLEHLILHAEDDQGWKALSMAISDSQDQSGFSIMNEEILRKYFGKGSIGHKHVIATSACVAGPISMVYRQNQRIKNEIQKIDKRKQRVVGASVDEDRIFNLEAQVADLEEELASVSEEEKSLKSVAGAKFTQREKSLAKLKESGNIDAYEKTKAEIEADKSAAEFAKESLESVKKAKQRLKKRINIFNKELNELRKLYSKSSSYDEQVVELRGKFISEEDMDKVAIKRLKSFEEIFGEGYFFAEIQYHGYEIETETYPNIVRVARKLNIPLVATNDVHIIDNSDDEVLKRQMLQSLRFENWNESHESDRELYLKSDQEMLETLSKIYSKDVVEESMKNSLAIAVRCNVEFKIGSHHPKYIPNADEPKDSYNVFIEHLQKGIDEKFPGGLDQNHRDRLNHEVMTMKNMGYIDYHLVVEDFLNYAALYENIPFKAIKDAPVDKEDLKVWIKEKGYNQKVGMATGAGRGSAGGSLVCSLLNITRVDPLNYGLLFERFLNPERVSMPDIDSDFSRTIRPRVIEYVKNKYGNDCVAGIVTQNAQAPKGSIRLAAKCFGLYENRDNKKDNGAKKYLSLGDKIAKAVPKDIGISFSDEIADKTVLESLKEEFANDEKALKILDWANTLEGVFTAYSAHAAGIVITDGTPIKEIVPLRWNKKLGIYTTQCDMVEVEENGMLKFDFLGLKTLDVINDCLWQLKNTGTNVNLYDIPLNDKEVFSEVFSKARTNSVFQFESSGMKNMLKRFQPETFDDLIILVAMFRPGPLQYIDGVIDVKNKVKPISFLDPQLEPILKETYGAIVYQEQVMEIFQKLAGYTLGGADLVRRAMSKKKVEKLRIEKDAFINGDEQRGIKGCVNNGIPAEIADQLFEQMMDFASYAFNKSHATVYAYLAYITGWLKYHHPAEFLMGAMRWSEKQGSKDPLPGLIGEARSFDVEVKPPRINESMEQFTVEDGSILFGLSAVKTVGASAEEIISEREKNGKFKSMHDFFKRTRIRKDAVENLILAGAFDEFYQNRKAMVDAVEDFSSVSTKLNNKESFYKAAKTMLPLVDNLKTAEEVIKKQENLGLNVELKAPTTKTKLQKRVTNAEKALEKLNHEFETLRVVTNIEEDEDERMRSERELLGAYVTAHPLDNYPTELDGIDTLDRFNQYSKQAYGLISEVTMRKRKKDGRDMAFLVLEDRFGTIKVNVYTKAFAENKNQIQVGNVVVIDGYAQEDGFQSAQDDDDDETNYLLVAQAITPAEKRKKSYSLEVSSMVSYHLDIENDIRKKYETKEGGSTLYIYDSTLKELRKMNYKVTNDIRNYPNVVSQYDN